MTTKHSRNLRIKTSSKWTQKKRDKGEIKQLGMTGSADLIDEIREGLANLNVEGSTADKIKYLLDNYNQTVSQ